MEVFKPRFSWMGWIISIAMFLLFLWLSWKVLTMKRGGIFIVHVFTITTTIGFSLVTLFFLIIYPTMRYEFTKDALWLKCGPFRWKILYSEIREIVKTDLQYHFSSTGWKLPGYTIGKVYYADRGYVRMCATSMCKNILLIKTDKSLFGVTPKEETKFIQVLKGKLE